jgi:hypothetical protein
MGDLTPEASALIRAGRTAFRPDATDRDRVLDSLRVKLGDAAFLDGPGQAELGKDGGAARLSLRGAKVWGGVTALAVGTAVIVAPRLWTRLSAHVEAAAPSSSIQTAEPEPSASIVAPNGEGAIREPARGENASSAPRSTVRPSASSTTSLTEEVRLLSKAERQLSDGLAEDALKTLGEHERRFPRGALAEERMAARVEALCALSRGAEARTELGRLSRAYPKSPHLDGARRFCGDELGATP